MFGNYCLETNVWKRIVWKPQETQTQMAVHPRDITPVPFTPKEHHITPYNTLATHQQPNKNEQKRNKPTNTQHTTHHTDTQHTNARHAARGKRHPDSTHRHAHDTHKTRTRLAHVCTHWQSKEGNKKSRRKNNAKYTKEPSHERKRTKNSTFPLWLLFS
jgi:hypothetical protein